MSRVFPSADEAFPNHDSLARPPEESALVDRRDFLKLIASLGGSAAVGRLFPELLTRMAHTSLENSARTYLIQTLAIPPQWSETVTPSERVNTRYRSPSLILDTAFELSSQEIYFDPDFPLLVDDRDLSRFYHDVSQLIGQEGELSFTTQAEQIFSDSPIKEPIDKLEYFFFERIFESYQDLVEEDCYEGVKPIWPSYGRILDRLPESVRMQLHDDAAYFKGVGTHRNRDQDESESIRSLFLKEYQAEMDEITADLESYQEAKFQRGGDPQLTIAEYINYFVEKNSGDCLRGLMDALHFTRDKTRTVKSGMDIKKSENDNAYLPGCLWLANLVQDNLSLTLPWDYLARYPDMNNAMGDAYSALLYGVEGMNNKKNQDLISKGYVYKEWHLVNRIGLLAHVLSIMILAGCVHESAVPPSILYNYYNFPGGLVSRLDEQDVSLSHLLPDPRLLLSGGVGSYQYAALVESMGEGKMSQHGRIKFSTDLLTTLSAGQLRRTLLRGKG